MEKNINSQKKNVQTNNPNQQQNKFKYQQHLKKLKCQYSHQTAQTVCISKKCNIIGLMCLKKQCQCRKKHQKCIHIVISRIFKSMNRQILSVSSQITSTYQSCYKIINQTIQQLTQFKKNIQNQQKNYGLRQKEIKFIQIVQSGDIQSIKGNLLQQIFKKSQKKHKIVSVKNQQVFQKLQQMQKKVKEAIKKTYIFKVKHDQQHKLNKINQQIALNQLKKERGEQKIENAYWRGQMKTRGNNNNFRNRDQLKEQQKEDSAYWRGQIRARGNNKNSNNNNNRKNQRKEQQKEDSTYRREQIRLKGNNNNFYNRDYRKQQVQQKGNYRNKRDIILIKTQEIEEQAYSDRRYKNKSRF